MVRSATAALSPGTPTRVDRHKAATTTPVSRPQRLQEPQRRPQQEGLTRQLRTREVSKSVSPARRRVTRSQSHELGISDEFSDYDGQPGRRARGKGKGKAPVKEMDPVAEEPVSSKRLSREEQQQMTVPESPEDHNISGTTFLPTDSEPEFGDLDPIMMIDALPDLQRAATAVLDFLVHPSSLKLRDVEELARELENPRSSQSRKLERLSANLSTHAKYFGSQTYIDVPHVSRAFPSLSVSESKASDWHVSGILYKANCARFALELLAHSRPTEVIETAIYSLEGRFPLPFLSALARDLDPRDAGISRLRRQTFGLALDIRTQFLKIGLNSRRDEPGFDPDHFLNHVFYNEVLETQLTSGEATLRGYTIPPFQDENGSLPSKYQDDVEDRIAEIRQCFDGESVNIEKLDDAFPWSDFIHSTARWIRLRTEEINQQLAVQVAFEDIQQLLEDEINQQSFEKRPRRSSIEARSVDRPTSPTEEPSQQPPRGLLPAAEITEKKTPGRFSFLNPSAIKTLFQREERLNSTERTPEGSPNQGNDLAGFISRHATREPASGGRNRANAMVERNRDPGPEIPASPNPLISISQPPEDDVVADSQAPESPSNVLTPSPHRANVGPSSIISSQETAAPPGSSQAVWAVIQRHKAALAKKASERKAKTAFIDRQTTATRVSPISENSQVHGSSQKKKKRGKRIVQEESDDDDDEFSKDTRRVDVATKRAAKPSSSKRPRLYESDSEEGIERQLQGELFSSSRVPRDPSGRRVSSATSHDKGHGRSVSRTASLVEEERTHVPPAAPSPPIPSRLLHPPSRDNIPNVRRRWTEAQNRRLIQLMAKIGPHWANIKRDDELTSPRAGGPMFTGKTQTQIKDRARNMVLEFYRNREPLPENFDQVTIKQVDKDRLRSLGIEVKDPPPKERRRGV